LDYYGGGELGSMAAKKVRIVLGMIPPLSGHNLNANDNVALNEVRLAA